MIVTAAFTALGIPATGLSPAITIRNAATGAAIVTAQAMTELGDGFYAYDFAGFDSAVDYVMMADGGATLLDEERYQFGTTSGAGELADLHDRLTADRAGYLDELSPASLPTDIEALLTRITAVRAGYLDNLSEGPVAVEANVEQHVYDAWNSMVGARAVTIHVADSATQEPVSNVLVYVYQLSRLIVHGFTDQAGGLAVALDDGDYTIVLRKIPYSFNVPEPITVTQDETFTMYGSTLIIAAPDPLMNCRLYEYCYKADGVTPMTTATGTAQLIAVPFNANSDRLISTGAINGTYDPVTGMIYWDIVRGATMKVSIPAVGFSADVLVPNQESARLTELQ